MFIQTIKTSFITLLIALMQIQTRSMTRLNNIIFLFLCVAFLAFVGSAHDHGKTKIGKLSVKADSSTRVAYASLIKLRHENTKFWLHAHEIRITRGGTFSVTAYREDDHGSYWQVLEEYDIPKKTKTYKDVVKCGQNIMLYASIVDYYLRTDDTQFGLTTQLLPLVHGIKQDKIDHGVVWKVDCVDKKEGQQLHYGDKIRLKHDTSGKYISTDGSSYYTEGNCGRGCSIVGQLQLHAIQNGHYSEHAVFQISGALSFDQQAVQQHSQVKQQ